MSTILNNLHADNIEVRIEKDGEYLAGYTEFSTQEDAELAARAFINGYELAMMG